MEVFFTLKINLMNALYKSKFSPEDSAYYIIGTSIQKITIKSVEIKSTSKSTETKYITIGNEEHIEKDLLTKRELIELLNTNGY